MVGHVLTHVLPLCNMYHSLGYLTITVHVGLKKPLRTERASVFFQPAPPRHSVDTQKELCQAHERLQRQGSSIWVVFKIHNSHTGEPLLKTIILRKIETYEDKSWRMCKERHWGGGGGVRDLEDIS